MKVLRQLIRFAMENKKFWLLPIALAGFVVGGLIALSYSMPLAPFIYPLF